MHIDDENQDNVREFIHTRAHDDKHVMSIQDRRSQIYLDLLQDAQSNADLMQIMEQSNPECMERIHLAPSTDDPQQRLLGIFSSAE